MSLQRLDSIIAWGFSSAAHMRIMSHQYKEYCQQNWGLHHQRVETNAKKRVS